MASEQGPRRRKDTKIEQRNESDSAVGICAPWRFVPWCLRVLVAILFGAELEGPYARTVVRPRGAGRLRLAEGPCRLALRKRLQDEPIREVAPPMDRHARHVRLALLASLIVGGCASSDPAKELERLDPGQTGLAWYLPPASDLPEGIALAESTTRNNPAAPVAYPPGSVDRQSEELGRAVFTRVTDEPRSGHVGASGDRVVVYVYMRRPGAAYGALEMSARVLHGRARRMRVLSGPRVVAVVVQEGDLEDRVVSPGFEGLAAWVGNRVSGRTY